MGAKTSPLTFLSMIQRTMGITEISIQSKVIDSDVGAFEVVFKKYYNPLCIYVNSILHDSDQSEEIVQDFFYNYWKNRKQIGIRLSLKSYLYQSVRNSALQYLRHKKIEHKHADYVLKSVDIGFNADLVENKEFEQVITDAFENLPERSKQIFSLSRYDGLKYKDIASSLSISVKTVEAEMSRTLAVLRRVVEQYNEVGNK